MGISCPGRGVCVSGVCLTAIGGPRRHLVADLSGETLDRSTLGEMKTGDRVNLERALKRGDRMSGHFVMGHVDGVSHPLARFSARGTPGRIVSRSRGASRRFVVEKGSVALDGVSLTVAARDRGTSKWPSSPRRAGARFSETSAEGARFNFEVDVFARYGAAGWRRRVGAAAARRRPAASGR